MSDGRGKSVQELEPNVSSASAPGRTHPDDTTGNGGTRCPVGYYFERLAW